MKQQSTTKGFAVLGMSTILVKVLSLVYLAFQSSIMKNYGNGVISAGMKIYTFIYSLTNVGLPVIISKLVSERVALGDYRSTKKIMRCSFSVLITLGAVSMLLMFFGAKWLAVNYCGFKEAELMLKMIAPTFLFTAVSCALRGYFQGRQNMMPTAVSQIMEQLFNTIFTVVFIWVFFNYAAKHKLNTVTYGAAGSTVGTSLGALAGAAVLAFVFYGLFRSQRRHEIRRQASDIPQLSEKWIYKEIARYAIPAVISTVAASAVDQIDVILCNRRLMAGGMSYSQAVSLFGVYTNQYQRLFMIAIAFSTPLVTAMIPAYSSALASGNVRLFRHKVGESYKILYILMMPSIAGLMFLAKPLITLVFARQNAGSDLVIFGMWSAVFMAVSYLQNGILIAMGRPMVYPVNTIIGMIPKVLCNYFLLPIKGIDIKGAIIGNAVGWIIACILNQIVISGNSAGKAHNTRYIIRPAIASVAMGVCCFAVYKVFSLLLSFLRHQVTINDLSILLTAAVGVLVYFIVLVELGGIKEKDILKIPMGSKLLRLLQHIPFLRAKLGAY